MPSPGSGVGDNIATEFIEIQGYCTRLIIIVSLDNMYAKVVQEQERVISPKDIYTQHRACSKTFMSYINAQALIRQRQVLPMCYE